MNRRAHDDPDSPVIWMTTGLEGSSDFVGRVAMKKSADLAAADCALLYAWIKNTGELLAATEEILSPETIAAQTNAQRLIIILDRSNEFQTLSARALNALCKIANTFPERQISLIFMQNNRCLNTDYEAHPAADKPRCAFHPYHHHLLRIMDRSEAQGVPKLALSLLNRVPKKGLLCLNNQPRYHRLYCLNWLIDSFPKDEVLATFGGAWQNDLIKPDKKAAMEERRFPGLPRYTDLERRVRASDIWVSTGGRTVGQLIAKIETDHFAKTFASLVTESEMSTGGVQRFTEKPIMALIMGHPFVVAGNPFAVAMLEELGFDMLRDEIDHSYDSVLEPGARLNAVLVEAKRLGLMTKPARHAFLRRNRKRLANNIALTRGPLEARLVAQWEALLAKQIDDHLVAMTSHC